jgi:hypothetical protein
MWMWAIFQKHERELADMPSSIWPTRFQAEYRIKELVTSYPPWEGLLEVRPVNVSMRPPGTSEYAELEYWPFSKAKEKGR